MNTKTVADKAAVQELFLYTVNNHKIHVNCNLYIIANLCKKYLDGTYDKDRAVIAWEVAATRAAKLYVHEFRCNNNYYRIFNAATRRECAQLLEEYYYENIVE